MPKSKSPTPEEQVDLYISKLDPEIAPVVQKIREIILSADKEIAEHIKWNSPAFYYAGEMKPFDPKEYRRDIAVCNLHKNRIMLVMPTGAKIKNGRAILEGEYSDGRRMINFKHLEDVEIKKEVLKEIIREWISLIEK